VSMEEDYLMRRMAQLEKALKGAGVLTQCSECTSLFAPDLERCPECGAPVPGSDAEAEAQAVEQEAVEESGETIDGQPVAYDSANVETLRGELDRRGVFVPGGTRKADLVGMLRDSDQARLEAGTD
jgi:hypothetical protein